MGGKGAEGGGGLDWCTGTELYRQSISDKFGNATGAGADEVRVPDHWHCLAGLWGNRNVHEFLFFQLDYFLSK